jgi:hypothetical protein
MKITFPRIDIYNNNNGFSPRYLMSAKYEKKKETSRKEKGRRKFVG